jgi:oligopeptidase B
VNEEARGRAFYDVTGLTVSPDGRYLAIGQDTVGGGEWQIRIRDLATGRWLADSIDNTAGDMVWANDSRNLFYVKQQAGSLIPDRVYLHTLGGASTADRLVYSEADDRYCVVLDKSRDEQWIFIAALATLATECWYIPADDPTTPPEVILPRQRGHEYDLDVIDNVAVILTNWDAQNFRVMTAPFDQVDQQAQWLELVAHRNDVLLHDFAVFRSHIVLEEMADANTSLRIIDRSHGHAFTVRSDEPAYTAVIDENPDVATAVLRYGYSSLATPHSIFEVDLAGGDARLLKRHAVPGYETDAYRTHRIQAPARDGTSIPVSLLISDGSHPDGSHPLYVLGYGAYGLSSHPEFDPDLLSLADRGFVVALAHVRGGQERGRAWYEAGRGPHKINSFTDFIDVTEHLLAGGWGDPRRVVASGRSAGGLLMGAVANLRPDLYTAIVTSVPFVDVVTTMLDTSIPLTTFERDEWGDPENAADFATMLSYSPYDQVAARSYPHMLVTTGLWDPAVAYWEPAKWVARLRELKTDDNPLLLWVDMEVGHQGPTGRYESLNDTAREFAFILDALQMAP